MTDADVKKMTFFMNNLSSRLWAIWGILHKGNPEMSYLFAEAISLQFKGALEVEKQYRAWLQKHYPKLYKEVTKAEKVKLPQKEKALYVS